MWISVLALLFTGGIDMFSCYTQIRNCSQSDAVSTILISGDARSH